MGLAGVFSYNLFLLITFIDSSLKYKDQTNIFFLIKSIIEIMQSVLQVLFVLESSCKFAKESEHINKKPGRYFVTFLMITHLSLWIISIVEAKKTNEHILFIQYYQKIPWSIIIRTLLPLVIFFRFHSIICLSDIWKNSYRLTMQFWINLIITCMAWFLLYRISISVILSMSYCQFNVIIKYYQSYIIY